ncbi:MAG: AMP-binding protein [Gemmatimonadetes bacterium]|nr:AMP-binding protein [Gemmatimonadota bacterium]NIO30508.1 AMP-binding protein [Gemmatimonadota bacterium]
MQGDTSTPVLRIAGAPADDPQGNVAQLFLEAVDTHCKPNALRYKKAGSWYDISHQQIYDDVKRVALGLAALGVEPGDRVAIVSENRPEWLLTDFGCVMSGTVSVPLYPSLPVDQICYMLRDSEAMVVFVSTEEQLAKVREAKADVPSLEYIIVYDESVGPSSGVRTFSQLLELGGERVGELPDDEYRARARETDPHETLTILYTSGTTGQPKGVVLTHNNLFSNVRSTLQVLKIDSADTSLSVLPLCHVFERMAGNYTMFYAGATICYAESFATVGANLLEIRPTVMTMVPRFYERTFAEVEEAARTGGPGHQSILSWAIDVAGARLDRKLEGKGAGPLLALQYGIADRLVFSKLRKGVGGRIRFFVSGGAPLSPTLARFFLSADLPIVEGYGLTETAPVISLNRLEAIRPGTVGEPIPGVEAAVAEDGEVLTRGPHVMKGYYKMPEATAAAIDPDGWFHTGDIGELSDDGYLKITDRKKDLIVTAGGKNIAPQPIEGRAKTNPYVSQVVMLGDRRRFPILVVVPDFGALESWAGSQGFQFDSREALVGDRRVIDFMESELLGSLADLARFERPKKIVLLPRELSIDAGEITPTLKVRRRIIEEKYWELIEPLYAEEAADR